MPVELAGYQNDSVDVPRVCEALAICGSGLESNTVVLPGFHSHRSKSVPAVAVISTVNFWL